MFDENSDIDDLVLRTGDARDARLGDGLFRAYPSPPGARANRLRL